MRGLTMVPFLPLLLGACEIAEVTTVPPEDVLVVDAVLRAGAARQHVLLHRSLSGQVVRGEPRARVSVTTPEGREVLFQEAPLADCAEKFSLRQTDSLRVEASCYISPPRSGGSLAVRPGETYELRVVTAEGRKLRSRTTVPGDFRFRAPAGASGTFVGTCALPPNTNLPLVWSLSRGAWSYLAAIEINGLRQAFAGVGISAPDRLELTGLAISERDTTLVLPAQFGIFDLDEVRAPILTYFQNGFPAGLSLRLTVAATDRNYVNGVRGGGFNPSGAVRIPSVVGDGTGVFGSVVARSFNVVVPQAFEEVTVPPCLPGTIS